MSVAALMNKVATIERKGSSAEKDKYGNRPLSVSEVAGIPCRYEIGSFSPAGGGMRLGDVVYSVMVFFEAGADVRKRDVLEISDMDSGAVELRMTAVKVDSNPGGRSDSHVVVYGNDEG